MQEATTRGALAALTFVMLFSSVALAGKKKEVHPEGWFDALGPQRLVLEYPILDDHLLGILAGEAPRASGKPRKKKLRPPPGRENLSLLGAPEAYEPEEAYRILQFTEAELDAGSGGGGSSSDAAPAPTATPGPYPDPGASYTAAEDSAFTGLYRRSDPTRGYVTEEKRYSYTPVTEQALPAEDRWRKGFPDYAIHDRGSLFNPYRQNILKGDFPIYGNRTFMNLSLKSDTSIEGRSLPTPSNIAARGPGSFPVFGRPKQHAFKENLILSLNVFVGDTAFEPPVFSFTVTPIFNPINTFRVAEVGVVVPDVRQGTDRDRNDIALQELFGEYRLAVLSSYFDFVSVRAGRQPFISDFRGFIFNDTNRGIRLFGNGGANRTSFNLAYFDMLDKDTNSELNTSKDRDQKVVVANVFRQDFLLPGYTLELAYHYNDDDPSFVYDDNGVLVRPALIGDVRPHQVKTNYYGILGDGHLGKVNITHAFYHVNGKDTFNQLAGRKVNVDAQMAAVEASYDMDWRRFKASAFYQSGDRDPVDGEANGFDSIFDQTNFAGGDFSFWSRQGIRLQGVGLKQRQSLVADLRSSKTQGQANHVNPGLFLYNVGADFDVTPKLKAIFNVNYLEFHHTAPLSLYVFQRDIPRDIGWDYSLGLIYRPDLNENIVLVAGAAKFEPEDGFSALFQRTDDLHQLFGEVRLTY